MDKNRLRSYYLWLLARRDYSRAQLTERALKKGALRDDVQSVLQEFKARGWFNEDAYTRMRARQFFKKGYSPRMVEAKLKAEKSTPTSALLEQAMEGAELDPTEILQNLIAKESRRLQRALSPDLDIKVFKRRLIHALLRKGHSFDSFNRYLSEEIERVGSENAEVSY